MERWIQAGEGTSVRISQGAKRSWGRPLLIVLAGMGLGWLLRFVWSFIFG